jgi:hypothetical protein
VPIGQGGRATRKISHSKPPAGSRNAPCFWNSRRRREGSRRFIPGTWRCSRKMRRPRSIRGRAWSRNKTLKLARFGSAHAAGKGEAHVIRAVGRLSLSPADRLVGVETKDFPERFGLAARPRPTVILSRTSATSTKSEGSLADPEGRGPPARSRGGSRLSMRSPFTTSPPATSPSAMVF